MDGFLRRIRMVRVRATRGVLVLSLGAALVGPAAASAARPTTQPTATSHPGQPAAHATGHKIG